ncbi:MAG: hypothetical protein ACOX3G_03005 [Armatimonadota bacterium]|jgi:hypothetical protein
MKKVQLLEDQWEKKSGRSAQEYMRIIDVDEDFFAGRVFVELDGLSAGSVIILNGQELGTTLPGKSSRISADGALRIGRNELVVRTSSEPPADGKLISYDKVSISGIRIDPEVVDNVANVWITVDVTNYSNEEQPVMASVIVSQEDVREKVEIYEDIPASGEEIEAVIRITDPSMWAKTDTGEPQYFDCLIGLQIAGEVMDVAAVRFDID